MARWNNFGAVPADVQNMFPGVQTSDFDDGSTNGTVRIQAALDRITRDVAAAFPPEVYTQATTVDCEEVVKYAAAGQTTGTLSLKPILANTLHLWQYPNTELWDPSRYPAFRTNVTSGFSMDWFYRKPTPGIIELDQSALAIALNLTTGVLTNLPAMSAGDRIFASYDVDVSSASFAMQSVADIVVYGAAAELGDRLFSQASAAWKLVEDYAKRYAAAIEKIRAGGWIPDEVRSVPHWTPVERSSDEVRSVRLYRGG
jgi:hypothetical protein